MAVTYTALGPSTKLVHYLKRNDTLPSLTVTLSDSDGVALNLSAVSGISFTMKDIDSDDLKINSAAATIENAAKGQVFYNFSSADTNLAGTYQAEFELNYIVANKLSVPVQGALTIVILEDFNNG